MHKLFLTNPECEIICNSEEIINDLGGFPSMEDGCLESVEILNNHGDYPRLKASLIFNISGWYSVGRHYGASYEPKHNKIKLVFDGLRNIDINSEVFTGSGEIKFGNTTNRKKMHQDDHPSVTPIVQRPFCSFYIRNGSGLLFEFDEKECKIIASYV